MPLSKIASRFAQELSYPMSRLVPEGASVPRLGTIACLKALPVAAEAGDRKVLSESSVKRLFAVTAAQVRRDCGLGTARNRAGIAQQLTAAGATGSWSTAVALVRTELPKWHDLYLDRWVAVLAAMDRGDSDGCGAGYREMGRLIGSHLLESGLSADLVIRAIDYFRREPDEVSAADLLAHFQQRVAKGPTEVEAIILIEQTVRDQVWGAEWMRPTEVKGWADRHSRTELLPPGFHGAVPVRALAWDKWQVARELASARDSIMERAVTISGKTIELSTFAIIDSFPIRLELERAAPTSRAIGYSMPAIASGLTRSDSPVEVAADFLMSSTRVSQPATAAVLLWAAVETLFSQPAVDNVKAGEIAADIACVQLTRHFAQVSLRMLASANQGDAAFRASIAALDPTASFERFVEYIADGKYGQIRHALCESSIDQLRPRLQVKGILEYRKDLREVLDHLYRERNLAVHGGVSDSPLVQSVTRLSRAVISATVHYLSRNSASSRVAVLACGARVAVTLDGMSDLEPSISVAKDVFPERS